MVDYTDQLDLSDLKINESKKDSKQPKPLFIGVVGGTASGKTSLCQRIG